MEALGAGIVSDASARLYSAYASTNLDVLASIVTVSGQVPIVVVLSASDLFEAGGRWDAAWLASLANTDAGGVHQHRGWLQVARSASRAVIWQAVGS